MYEWEGELIRIAEGLDLDGLRRMLAMSDNPALHEQFRDDMKTAVHLAWMKIDLLGALHSADEGGVADLYVNNFMESALTMWAKQNPEEAMDYLKNNSLKRFDRNEQLIAMMAGIAYGGRIDVDLVTQGLSMVDEPSARKYSINEVSATWAMKRETDKLDQWIDTLAGDEQLRAKATAIEFLVINDPVEAVRRFDEFEAPAEMVEKTLILMVTRWAEQDSAAAAEWLLSLPNSETKRLNMVHVLDMLEYDYPEEFSKEKI
jgi:hypothetical protein